MSLRYFKLGPDGAPAYLTQADIDAQAHHPTALRDALPERRAPLPTPARTGRCRRLRHVAFNLDDAHLKADGSLLAHLSAQGKGRVDDQGRQSPPLERPLLARFADWLIEHTDWMISDSTGIPPRYAQPAGFAQDTYGTFDGPAPFGLYDKRDADDLKQLFDSEPPRDLAFRYGYPDQAGHAHLLVTRRDGNVADSNTKRAPLPAPAASR